MDKPEHEILTIEIPLPKGMTQDEARTQVLVHLQGQTIEQALTCVLQDAGVDVPANAELILSMSRWKRQTLIEVAGLSHLTPEAMKHFIEITSHMNYPKMPVEEDVIREARKLYEKQERTEGETKEDGEEGSEEASA